MRTRERAGLGGTDRDRVLLVVERACNRSRSPFLLMFSVGSCLSSPPGGEGAIAGAGGGGEGYRKKLFLDARHV